MYKRDPRKQGLQQYGFTGPAQMQPIQGIAPPPITPVQSQPSLASQATGMVADKVMNVGMNKASAMAQPYIDKGIAYGTNKLGTLMGTNQAATAGTAAMENAALGAAAEGGLGAAMGGLGTAMPYVGMGLLAGKALGLFSRGGYVGPLSKATYAANGEKITAEFIPYVNPNNMINKEPYKYNDKVVKPEEMISKEPYRYKKDLIKPSEMINKEPYKFKTYQNK